MQRGKAEATPIKRAQSGEDRLQYRVVQWRVEAEGRIRRREEEAKEQTDKFVEPGPVARKKHVSDKNNNCKHEIRLTHVRMTAWRQVVLLYIVPSDWLPIRKR